MHTHKYLLKSWKFLVSPLSQHCLKPYIFPSLRDLFIQNLHQLILIDYLSKGCFIGYLLQPEPSVMLRKYASRFRLYCYFLFFFFKYIHIGRVKKLSIISLAHFFRNQQSAGKLLIEKFYLISCYQTKYVLQL